MRCPGTLGLAIRYLGPVDTSLGLPVWGVRLKVVIILLIVFAGFAESYLSAATRFRGLACMMEFAFVEISLPLGFQVHALFDVVVEHQQHAVSMIR
jgi:hypothetical protein